MENRVKATFVSSIILYSARYRQRMLGEYDPDRLLADWWRALEFFFCRTCFQGRRDEVSEGAFREVVAVRGEQFSGKDNMERYGMASTI